MIKNSLFSLSLLITGFLSAQKSLPVMTIDNKAISKEEFLQVYLKNNNAPKYDQQSLDEYMEMFKKFKLKVAEAEALGYDTIPKLKKELIGYRKQLAAPYLIDSTQNQAMVREAYEHMKTEIRASHILIRLTENSSPADTLVAFKKMEAIKKRIEAGEDFNQVAKATSEDPSVQKNNGDLGYFTGFMMVYPFEKAAFDTKVGQLSQIIRTRFGYHLLKVFDSRTARGTMQAAHIMIGIAKDATPEDISSAEKKANEIYVKLQAGDDFAKLAKEFSDDAQSAEKGGELQLFGTGTSTRMIPEFETAAFALTKNGQFSQPVRTVAGYHIIKRIDLVPLVSFDQMKKELQGKVNKDERSSYTQASYVNKLKKQYGFSDKYKKTSKWFIQNIDSNYHRGLWNYDKLKSNKAMFTLGKNKFTQKEFADYLKKNYRNVPQMDPALVAQKHYATWQKESILAYEESKLDAKYPEFKALMQEYHDGILLYEVMTDKVWNKAIKDTSGLRSFYNQNQAKYVYGKRYNCYVYECLSADIAKNVESMLRSSDTISSKTILPIINKESELNLKVKTGNLEADVVNHLKGRNLQVGVNPMYVFENKTYVVKVLEIISPTQKKLTEAKGPVTSDYQNYLEKQWLDELTLKHPIVINKEVLYSLGK